MTGGTSPRVCKTSDTPGCDDSGRAGERRRRQRRNALLRRNNGAAPNVALCADSAITSRRFTTAPRCVVKPGSARSAGAVGSAERERAVPLHCTARSGVPLRCKPRLTSALRRPGKHLACNNNKSLNRSNEHGHRDPNERYSTSAGMRNNILQGQHCEGATPGWTGWTPQRAAASRVSALSV